MNANKLDEEVLADLDFDLACQRVSPCTAGRPPAKFSVVLFKRCGCVRDYMLCHDCLKDVAFNSRIVSAWRCLQCSASYFGYPFYRVSASPIGRS